MSNQTRKILESLLKIIEQKQMSYEHIHCLKFIEKELHRLLKDLPNEKNTDTLPSRD